MKIFEKLLNLIFPKHTSCVICGNELDHNEDSNICNACENDRLEFIDGKICERCGQPVYSMENYCLKCKEEKHEFDIARAPLIYNQTSSLLVLGLKNSNKKYLASSLGYYMVLCAKKYNITTNIIVPIPLGKKRKRTRGFNQSELLANYVGDKLNIPIDTKNLIKKIDTEHQTGKTYKDRQTNLKDSFCLVDKNVFKDKTIMIIDDVYTTGATVRECTRLLKEKGEAKSVIVLTATHTIIKTNKQN